MKVKWRIKKIRLLKNIFNELKNIDMKNNTLIIRLVSFINSQTNFFNP